MQGVSSPNRQEVDHKNTDLETLWHAEISNRE